MRLDIGLILSIILEYIFFIYYADTLFYSKRSKISCCAIIMAGYILNFAICTFGNVILNTLTIITVHFLCFRLCYHISRKSAAFQIILLDSMNLAAECLIVFIPYIGIIPNQTVQMSSTQSFILTVASKALYLTGIMIISRVFCAGRKNIKPASVGLLSIPVLTAVIILSILNINITSNLLSLVCLILIIINIVVFNINQKILVSEAKTKEIEDQRLKEKIDYDEYMMLKESQQQAIIFNHDFKAHIDALSSLIGEDNEAAQTYIKDLTNGFAKSQFTEYSDNKILNVLLSKKEEECQNKNIQFFIDPIQANLQFFSDMDTVTIFSNLINNAIESCINSKDKKIYLNIYTANKSFVIIKIENTSDTKPIVINGKLKTHKDNSKLHGIGMNSITRALKAYNGLLTWEYNETDKIFSTKIIIRKFKTAA